MFQLSAEERDQLVTICHRFKTMKHSSTLPYAFTEHVMHKVRGLRSIDKNT